MLPWKFNTIKCAFIIMRLITIKYRDIPKCLRNGDFYRSLDSDDSDGDIEIPCDCYSAQTVLALSLEKFTQLIRVTMFWMLDEVPRGILAFCADSDVNVWYSAVLSVPGALESTFLAPLALVYKRGETSLLQAIETGKWEIIVHFLKRENKGSSSASVAAAQQGNLQLLKYLHEQGFAWNRDLCLAASSNGCLECLKYAHENGCPWDDGVYTEAALKGHLHILEYAFEQGLEWCEYVCENAVEGGHLHCLRFVHTHGCPWSSDIVKLAIARGKEDCLLYLLEQNNPVPNVACNLACRFEHFGCLKLLLQRGAECDTGTMSFAAKFADIAFLIALHEHGCPWNWRTPAAAAHGEDPACLQYALEQGCDYDGNLVLDAVEGGNLLCVQYLIEEQGLYLDETIYQAALLCGNFAMVQYLIDQGCPYLDCDFCEDEDEVAKYNFWFTKDNPDFVRCVQYMVERGATFSRGFVTFVRDQDAACMEYLVSEKFVEPEPAPMPHQLSDDTIELEQVLEVHLNAAPVNSQHMVGKSDYTDDDEFEAALLCAAIELSLLG